MVDMSMYPVEMPLFLTAPYLWDALASDDEDDDELWMLTEWHDEGWTRGLEEGRTQGVEDTLYHRARDDFAILDESEFPMHLLGRKGSRRAYRRGYTDGYEAGYAQVYQRHAVLLHELRERFAVQWACIALFRHGWTHALFDAALVREIRAYALAPKKMNPYRPIDCDLFPIRID
jgi:hypothetical protein